MKIQKSLGNKIKSIRISQNISQEKFAELADLDRTYVSSIEMGNRNISIVVIEKIAKAFKITPSELLKDI